MSMWPETMKVGPLREWPGTPTPASMRRNSTFRAPLASTLEILEREIYHLAGTRADQDSAELLIAVLPGGFRKDGRPRLDAKAEHPGVVFTMDTKHGHLSYPSDRHNTWEENLRAIALTLENLRRIDRYGVTTMSGQQYRGFLALESGAPAAMTVDQAIATIGHMAGWLDATVRTDVGAAWRRARRAAHPDTGGSSEDWHLLTEAERVLREAGVLR